MTDDEKIIRAFIAAPDGYAAAEALLRPVVEKALRIQRDTFTGPPELVYRGIGDFLLQHGTWYTRVANIPRSQRTPRGYCYGTAIACAAQYGEKYVEGVALGYDGSCLAMHAWNIHPEYPTVVVDRSWGDAPGLIYCGVEFSVGRADDATWQGDSCVLNDFNRGYPLFRQPWAGEPGGLTWRESPVTALLKLAQTDKNAARLAAKEMLEGLQQAHMHACGDPDCIVPPPPEWDELDEYMTLDEPDKGRTN